MVEFSLNALQNSHEYHSVGLSVSLQISESQLYCILHTNLPVSAVLVNRVVIGGVEASNGCVVNVLAVGKLTVAGISVGTAVIGVVEPFIIGLVVNGELSELGISVGTAVIGVVEPFIGLVVNASVFGAEVAEVGISGGSVVTVSVVRAEVSEVGTVVIGVVGLSLGSLDEAVVI